MPTLEEVLKATRPISYDNHDEMWPYSTRGSCVVVRLSQRLYVLTALHVPKGYKPSEMLIPYEEGSEHFLSLQESFVITTPEMEDTDHKDILFLEVWRDQLDVERLKETTVTDITGDSHKTITKDTKYVISGYPFSLNIADYEEECLFHQAVHIFATLEHSDIYLGVDQIRFHSDASLESSTGLSDDDPFNGMSGGGLFSLTPKGDGEALIAFQGILLRATASSRIGYILKTDIIKSYINRQQRKPNS